MLLHWICSIIHFVTSIAIIIFSGQHWMKINCVLEYHQTQISLFRSTENMNKTSEGPWFVLIQQPSNQFSLVWLHQILYQRKLINQAFTPIYLRINSGYKIEQVNLKVWIFSDNKNLQQLGHSGQNVLDHVFPPDEESVRKTMDAMDWSMKKKNVGMLKIRASNNYPIFYQKVVIPY